MADESPAQSGIWAKSREDRMALALSLLNRGAERMELAKEAFRRAYPTAPEQMIGSAVFHVYTDGSDAAMDWLADVELFLRDPNHRLCTGVSSHLLYHVYNWLQFEAMLPLGRPGLLERLGDLKQYAEEGDLDAVRGTVEVLMDMIEPNESAPGFDRR
jgi:hypothetical protein